MGPHKHRAPIPMSHHGTAPISMPTNLQQAKYVFIHRDGHRTPPQRCAKFPLRLLRVFPRLLQLMLEARWRPSSSLKVVESGPYAFTIDVGGKMETIKFPLRLLRVVPRLLQLMLEARWRPSIPFKVVESGPYAFTIDVGVKMEAINSL